MQPPSTSGAHLTILSKALDAAELAELVGLKPDETWERGAKRHAAGELAGITFRSGRADEADPGEHLETLLERLRPAATRIAQAAADDRVIVRLWLIHRIENWNPGLSLSAGLIRRIDRFGTGIEIDIYVLNANEIVAHTA